MNQRRSHPPGTCRAVPRASPHPVANRSLDIPGYSAIVSPGMNCRNEAVEARKRQMTPVDHRPVRTVLIPWVIALVTLIGLNALVSDHARIRKSQSSGELELSQLADDLRPLGRVFGGQDVSFPDPADLNGAMGSSRFVLVDPCPEQRLLRFENGAIRGRAPPRWLLA